MSAAENVGIHAPKLDFKLATPSPKKIDFVQPKPETSSSLFSKVKELAPDLMSLGLRVAIRKVSWGGILPALNKTDLEKKAAKANISAYQHNNQSITLNIKVQTHDGATIDGFIVFANEKAKENFEKSGDKKDQKWIINCNGNSELYGENLPSPYLDEIRQNTGANLVYFDYRGCGDSKQPPSKTTDLVTDAQAIVDFLGSKNVQQEDITLNSRSLGGGVGTQVALRNKNVGLISERSFESLSKGGEKMIKNLFAEAISKKGGEILGKSVGTVFGKIVGFTIKISGQDLESSKAIRQMLKDDPNRHIAIIFSKRDASIDYEGSAYKGLKKLLGKKLIKNEEMLNPDSSAENAKIKHFPEYQNFKAVKLDRVRQGDGENNKGKNLNDNPWKQSAYHNNPLYDQENKVFENVHAIFRSVTGTSTPSTGTTKVKQPDMSTFNRSSFEIENYYKTGIQNNIDNLEKKIKALESDKKKLLNPSTNNEQGRKIVELKDQLKQMKEFKFPTFIPLSAERGGNLNNQFQQFESSVIQPAIRKLNLNIMPFEENKAFLEKEIKVLNDIVESVDAAIESVKDSSNKNDLQKLETFKKKVIIRSTENRLKQLEQNLRAYESEEKFPVKELYDSTPNLKEAIKRTAKEIAKAEKELKNLNKEKILGTEENFFSDFPGREEEIESFQKNVLIKIDAIAPKKIDALNIIPNTYENILIGICNAMQSNPDPITKHNYRFFLPFITPNGSSELSQEFDKAMSFEKKIGVFNALELENYIIDKLKDKWNDINKSLDKKQDFPEEMFRKAIKDNPNLKPA